MNEQADTNPRPGAPSRRAFLGGLTAAGMIGAAGCRLGRETPAKRSFVLVAPVATGRARDPGGPAPAGVLLVRPFRVASVFDARSFVIRRGESEYAADAYNGFLASPGALLTEAVAGWVRGLGAFAVVSTGGSQLAPSHALEGEVGELYGDYRDPAQPQAVLALRLRLLHPLAGSAAGVRWQRDERRAVPLERAGAEELVGGWNRALAGICESLDVGLFERGPMPGGPQARGGDQAGGVTG